MRNTLYISIFTALITVCFGKVSQAADILFNLSTAQAAIKNHNVTLPSYEREFSIAANYLFIKLEEFISPIEGVCSNYGDNRVNDNYAKHMIADQSNYYMALLDGGHQEKGIYLLNEELDKYFDSVAKRKDFQAIDASYFSIMMQIKEAIIDIGYIKSLSAKDVASRKEINFPSNRKYPKATEELYIAAAQIRETDFPRLDGRYVLNELLAAMRVVDVASETDKIRDRALVKELCSYYVGEIRKKESKILNLVLKRF